MAKTGISEATFAFALLNEIVNRLRPGIITMPVLPNTVTEAELGYDVEFSVAGKVFFFQFKITDFMSSKNARYLKSGVHKSAYFELSLHPANNFKQHNLLVNLSKREPRIYYVAPQVESAAKLRSCFQTRSITKNSKFMNIAGCSQLAQARRHHITYESGARGFTLHSEPTYHDSYESGEDFLRGLKKDAESWDFIDKVYSGDLLKNFKRTAEESDGPVAHTRPISSISIDAKKKSVVADLLEVARIAMSEYQLIPVLFYRQDKLRAVGRFVRD